jgi:type I restriction enzyme S subunit
VYYFLQTLGLSRFDVGNSNPTLNRNHIHRLPIKIPDIDTQRLIAGILANYDDVVANNRRRIELLERSARLLFEEWFVRLRYPRHEHDKIVDGIPESWQRKRIDEIGHTIGGGTPKTSVERYWNDGDITWFVPSDITQNECLVLLRSERKITEAGLRESSAQILPDKAVLMTSRASVGFFGLYDEGPCCTNQGFISIVPKLAHSRYYILHNLMHRKDEVVSRASGATYKEINKTTFRNMTMIVPAEGVRKDFEDICADIYAQVRCLKMQSEKAQSARELLLPRLMDGRIAV